MQKILTAKLLLFVFLFVLAPLAKCQIKILNTSKGNNENTNVVFDSLENFKTDPTLYVGQTFFVKPINESRRQYGYSKIYPRKNGRIWVSHEGYPYDLIAEKYLLVTDVVKLDSSKLYSPTIIVMQDKQSNDTLYFEFDRIFKHSFPFLVEGYFEKLKKTYLGKKYVSRFSNNHNDPILDINGQPILNRVGDVWEITDVILEDRYYGLQFLLKNSEERLYATAIDDLTSENFRFLYPHNEAVSLMKRYGQPLYKKALSGVVSIGMSKDLCELAWGKPSNINTSIGGTNREQWVYEGRSYLYFTNGKLTTIQN